MARIDPDRAQVVLRLVYDGPAKAGKTTSLRQLARSLGVDLFSADEEDGRTLYFDWLDYVGGLFEGMPIRCQVLSAPGQLIFESRRRLLLQSADAVVFVADSRPERLHENRRAYATLLEVGREARVPIGIVVQANKRDLPDAVSLDALRDSFGEGFSLAMTEAVAGRGEGVRETFVLGVRIALDRVRSLWSGGALETRPPEFENGAQLLASMMTLEGGVIHDTPMFVPPPSHSSADGAPSASHPRPPDASIPPGLVWPPVQGRIIVHEATRDALELQRDDSGSWDGMSSSGRWRVISAGGAAFRDLEHGRDALISWARWHAAASSRLSAERAIALVPDGEGEWRLWQIVHVAHTLRDHCRDAVHLRGAAAGEKLFDILDLYAQAFEVLVTTGLVEDIALNRIAVSANGTPVYAGAVSYPSAREPRPQTDSPASILESDLLAALRDELGSAPDRLSELLAGIEAAAARRGRTHVAESLRQGLLHS